MSSFPCGNAGACNALWYASLFIYLLYIFWKVPLRKQSMDRQWHLWETNHWHFPQESCHIMLLITQLSWQQLELIRIIYVCPFRTTASSVASLWNGKVVRLITRKTSGYEKCSSPTGHHNMNHPVTLLYVTKIHPNVYTYEIILTNNHK